MARVDNETCVELHNVAKSGLSNTSNSLMVKGTWYPDQFSLAVTDGVNAWMLDATLEFVMQRANELKVSTAQYVDKAHLHLGELKETSLYSLYCLGSSGATLLCTPRDGRDLNMDFTLNLPLKEAPVVDLTFDMVQFLMHAYLELVKKSEEKSRTFKRTKATLDKTVVELQSKKAMLETQMGIIKTSFHLVDREEEVALVTWPPSPVEQGKIGSNGEGNMFKKRSPWKDPKVLRPGIETVEETTLKTSATPLEARAEGAPLSDSQAGLVVVNKAIEDGRSAEEEQSHCEEAFEVEDRSNVKSLAAFRIDGSMATPHPSAQIAVRKTPTQFARKKRGRTRKDTAVHAEAAEDELLLARAFGGPKKVSLVPRDMTSEHRIKEQAGRAIKLLEPFTKQLSSPGNIGRLSLSPHLAEKPAGKRRRATLASKIDDKRFKPRRTSADTSPQSSVALPLALSKEKPGSDAADEQVKEFDVLNADFYDFDNERSKYVMRMGQYWALYDNQDGMPRFYGRIVNLALEPFKADIEWLEPYRPALGSSCLVKSAGLSAACGEFKRATIDSQPLPAFSHRIEVDSDARKTVYRLYPKKREIWALYKNWDKVMVKKNPKDDIPQYEYELVEVLTDYSKENGVKVGPITKVPGYKTVFRSGGQMLPHWIPVKNVQAQFSHQIATHRFNGNETLRVVPTGSFGLDSASTPEEFMLSAPGIVIDTPIPAVEVLQTVSESG